MKLAARSLLIATIASVACTRGSQWTPEERAVIANFSPLPPPPPSAGNAFADDERAAEVGKRLFFDRELSADGRHSCASCHDPERWFADGRAHAKGIAPLFRNTPSVIMAPWFPWLGWDGRADSVWSQALGPLENPREMGMTPSRLARHIASRHRPEYEAVFGSLPAIDHDVPRDLVDRVVTDVGRALDAYQRRLRPGPSPFDLYVAAVASGDPSGGDHLSAGAIRGLRQFVGEGRCVLCHHGPRLSDGEFHNLGLTDPPGAPAAEREGRSFGARALQVSPYACGGRGPAACDALRFVDSASPELLGAFRTPSLRNVAETAPYMHGGQLATLEDVVAFYRSAPRVPAIGRRDPVLALVPRSLSTSDLVAFLRTLTSAPAELRWTTPPAEVHAVDPSYRKLEAQ